MTVVTTYICDRCGHKQDNGVEMWGIGVAISQYHFNLKGSDINAEHKKLWCRKCMETLCALPAADPKTRAHIPNVPPTFEELVRKIIHDEIVAAGKA